MSTPATPLHPVAPSPKKIVKATAAALAVAIAILFAFVLPAEYGIDPLHTGRALGLTDLAQANERTAAPAETAPAPAAAPRAPETERRAYIKPELVPAAPGQEAPTVKDVFIGEPHRWQYDARKYTLAPGEGMEVKYDMKKGAGLVYSWTASAPLLFEMHGEPDVKPAGKQGTDYYESYDLHDKTGAAESHGTFLAPSTGIHGWFWENRTGTPVTLTIANAGYFDWLTQNRKDKHTAFKPIDPDSLPSHPTVPDEVLR